MTVALPGGFRVGDRVHTPHGRFGEVTGTDALGVMLHVRLDGTRGLPSVYRPDDLQHARPRPVQPPPASPPSPTSGPPGPHDLPSIA